DNHTPTLTATASDTASGVAGVQFQVSGDNGATWSNVGPPVTAAPYSVTVASPLAGGAYLARAVATDAAGNSAASAAVGLTVAVTTASVTGPTAGVTGQSLT